MVGWGEKGSLRVYVHDTTLRSQNAEQLRENGWLRCSRTPQSVAAVVFFGTFRLAQYAMTRKHRLAYLRTCLPAWLPVYLAIYLPTCLFAYLPTRLPACLLAYQHTGLPA